MKFRFLSLGGCPLNNPLTNLDKRGFADSMHHRMGFRRAPFSLSISGAIQLVQFISGKLEIPAWIREYCYADPVHVPNAAQQALLPETDIVMMEMSSPIEFVYEGFILNQNRFRERVLTPLRDIDKMTRSLTNKWINEGIQKQNEELRKKYSSELLKVLTDDTEAVQRLRDVVDKLRGRHVREQEIYQGFKTLLPMLPAPLVLVLHNYSYMPDGRPVIWPSDFKDNSSNAARRHGIPLYDPMEVVQRHWGSDVLMEDRRHYARSFDKYVADEYLALARVWVPKLVFGPQLAHAA
ncbi:hypothetical protein FZC33_01985 [Labrys sp. KNU-23]|uniref:hypothetical protein n=1 Tax=Labrys sp. KNU-23 TaxID=2789216 RepID=UPI0011EFB65E|nr:hypothetical protein [Labrys sp. KNU-23]QEN85054.1 hypothetical protein FZC33_01985 [Labrys sp. KNU-23]